MNYSSLINMRFRFLKNYSNLSVKFIFFLAFCLLLPIFQCGFIKAGSAYCQETQKKIVYDAVELFSFNCPDLKVDYKKSSLNCSKNSEISAFMSIKTARGEKFLFYSNVTGTIYMFSQAGEFEKSFKIIESAAMADYPHVCDMAYSKSGFVYLLDCSSSQVTVLNQDLKIVNRKILFKDGSSGYSENDVESQVFSSEAFNYISVDFMSNIRIYNPFDNKTAVLSKENLDIVKIYDGCQCSFANLDSDIEYSMFAEYSANIVKVFYQAGGLNSEQQKVSEVSYPWPVQAAFHIGTAADGKTNYFFVKTLNFDKVSSYILEISDRGAVKSNVNVELAENVNKNFKITTFSGGLVMMRRNGETYSVCALKKNEVYDSEQ